MSTLDLSVIVPTHLRADSLERTLRSFRDQTLAKDRYEIVVVSNYDDRRVVHHVEQAKSWGLQARYDFVGALGVNRARNRGLERARGAVLFFLDDDCRLLRRDHLEVLVGRFDAERAVSLRGGFYRDPFEAASTVRDYNAIVNAWLLGRSTKSGPMAGGNFSVRASAVGGSRFDESIAYGGSEVGFQLELARAGIEGRLDSDLDVEHDCDTTRLRLIKKAWLQGRRKIADPSASLRTSLLSLASSEVSAGENLKRLAFGICYGGVSQLGWLSAQLATRIDESFLLRDHPGIVDDRRDLEKQTVASGSRDLR